MDADLVARGLDGKIAHEADGCRARGADDGLARRGKIASNGIDQSRNVWLGKPTLPLFNPDWVTYAFKNVGEFSPLLTENRLVLPYSLLGKARYLWEIVRGALQAVAERSLSTDAPSGSIITIFALRRALSEAWDTLRDAPHRQPHIAWMVAPKFGLFSEVCLEMGFHF